MLQLVCLFYLVLQCRSTRHCAITKSSSSGATPLSHPSLSLLFSSSSKPHLSCMKCSSDLMFLSSLASAAALLAIETASCRFIQTQNGSKSATKIILEGEDKWYAAYISGPLQVSALYDLSRGLDIPLPRTIRTNRRFLSSGRRIAVHALPWRIFRGAATHPLRLGLLLLLHLLGAGGSLASPRLGRARRQSTHSLGQQDHRLCITTKKRTMKSKQGVVGSKPSARR